MGDTTRIGQLFTDETYLEKVARQLKIPVSSVDLAFRSTVSLVTACLHQQAQTAIGKGLLYGALEKQAQHMDSPLTIESAYAIGFEWMISEGNRLLAKLLPGKKSAIMIRVRHHCKLSYRQVDQLVGLGVYSLFSQLASHWQLNNELTSLLIPFQDLAKMAPELDETDYRSMGVHDNLALLKKPITYISI